MSGMKLSMHAPFFLQSPLCIPHFKRVSIPLFSAVDSPGSPGSS